MVFPDGSTCDDAVNVSRTHAHLTTPFPFFTKNKYVYKKVQAIKDGSFKRKVESIAALERDNAALMASIAAAEAQHAIHRHNADSTQAASSSSSSTGGVGGARGNTAEVGGAASPPLISPTALPSSPSHAAIKVDDGSLITVVDGEMVNVKLDRDSIDTPWGFAFAKREDEEDEDAPVLVSELDPDGIAVGALKQFDVIESINETHLASMPQDAIVGLLKHATTLRFAIYRGERAGWGTLKELSFMSNGTPSIGPGDTGVGASVGAGVGAGVGSVGDAEALEGTGGGGRAIVADIYGDSRIIAIAVQRTPGGGGFGIEVADRSSRDGSVRPVITKVFLGSAAAAAGVVEGDGLVAVNGQDVRGAAYSTIVDTIGRTPAVLELHVLRSQDAPTLPAGIYSTTTSSMGAGSAPLPPPAAAAAPPAAGPAKLKTMSKQSSFTRPASLSAGDLGLQKSTTIAVDIFRPFPGAALGLTLMGMKGVKNAQHIIRSVDEAGLCAETLQFGDVIVAVNSKSALEMTPEELAAELSRCGTTNGDAGAGADAGGAEAAGVNLVIARDYAGAGNEAGHVNAEYGQGDAGDLTLSGGRWHSALESAYNSSGKLRKSKVVMKW